MVVTWGPCVCVVIVKRWPYVCVLLLLQTEALGLVIVMWGAAPCFCPRVQVLCEV